MYLVVFGCRKRNECGTPCSTDVGYGAVDAATRRFGAVDAATRLFRVAGPVKSSLSGSRLVRWSRIDVCCLDVGRFA